ncbi:uncharacterized protein [Macaca nemestrina]|uniref:uncharacterized protein n=1 Tax=Macaca nemestrina TaxID=9545 RepID=UPI0039B8B04C
MASARTGAERAEPEPERAVRRRRWRQRAGGRAGCAGDRSRASRGGRGERAAGRERAPGARGGRATLLFLIQWRVSGPAAASGGAGERQPQRAGEGELERGPASGPGSAAGSEGEPLRRRRGSPSGLAADCGAGEPRENTTSLPARALSCCLPLCETSLSPSTMIVKSPQPRGTVPPMASQSTEETPHLNPISVYQNANGTPDGKFYSNQGKIENI